jgi:REP-associated tyrosine transposase
VLYRQDEEGSGKSTMSGSLEAATFVNELFREAEKKQMRQMKIHRSGKTINNIIKEECERNRVSQKELQGGSRRKTVSTMRASIARRSLDELGLSMAEIARHVGVNTSSITRTIAKLEKRGGDSYAP